MNGYPSQSTLARLPFFYGWVVVACAACANVARQAAAVAPLSIFIVPMTTEFEWSRAAMSGAVSLGGLLGALVSPVFGRLIDRRGPRMVLFLSTLVIGGACFALAGTSSLITFYVAFAIGRMTFLGPMDLGITSIQAKWFQRYRARANSLGSLGHYIGLALMPLLAQFVIGEHGWRAGWISLGLVVLVVGALPVLLFMVPRPEDIGRLPDGDKPGQAAQGRGPPTRTNSAREFSFTLGEAMRTPALWLLMVYSGLLFMVQAGMSLHQAPHLVERGLSAEVAASVVSVFSLSALGSALLVGAIGDRVPLRVSLFVSAAVMAASTVVMHSVTSPVEGFAAAILFGGGIGIGATLLPVAFANYYGREHYGSIRGVTLSAQVLGQAAGPLIAGLLYDLSGSYYKPFAVFFLLCVACAALALLAGKPARPKPATAATRLAAAASSGILPQPGVSSGSVYPVVRLFASLLLMTLGGSVMYASITVLAPISEEFGGGRAVGSLPFTVFMVCFGVGGVLMGRMSDRIGILSTALFGCVCLAIGLLMAAQATTMVQFLLALGLCGLLGASFTFAPLVADISHWFTARRGLAVGVVITGNYLAGAVWPPIQQALYDSQGWRATFVDLSLLTIVAMLPLSALLYRRSPAETGPVESAPLVSDRPLGMRANSLQCLLCVAGIGCCVAMAMPQVHIIPYALDLGIPATRGAEMMSLMLGFGILSRLGSGWLSDRIGGIRTLILGSVLQGLVLIGFLFADSLLSLYLVSIAFGLAQGGIVPSYAIIIRTFLPAGESGWRIATAILFTISGMALGGWMAGALYDLTGSYTMSF